MQQYKKHLTVQLSDAKKELELTEEQGQDWEFAGVGLKGLAVDLGVVYLEASTGLAAGNLQRLEGIRKHVATRGRPFVLIGDFNVPPEVMEASDWIKEMKAVAIRPEGVTATCTSGKGDMLDYVVVSRCLQAAVRLRPAAYSPWKPHIGLLLLIWGDPQHRRQRCLISPMALPDIAQEEEQKSAAQKDSSWQEAWGRAERRLGETSQGILGSSMAICSSKVAKSLGQDAWEVGKDTALGLWLARSTRSRRQASAKTVGANTSAEGNSPSCRPRLRRRQSPGTMGCRTGQNWYHDTQADAWEELAARLLMFSKLRERAAVGD